MILLAALLVAGDLQQARQTAEIEMLKCFYVQAAELDDRVSDAGTIGRAVLGACHPQFDEWKYASLAELQPPSATRFYAGLERAASNLAVQVVLKVRSKRH